METQLCNFADDNTLYGCGTSIDIVATKLEADMLLMLEWFKINSIVVNASNFQVVFLGKQFMLRYRRLTCKIFKGGKTSWG